MSRGVLAVSACALASCDVVFGTKPPTDAPVVIDAAIDAPIVTHRGRLVRRLVSEGADITTHDVPYGMPELRTSSRT